MMPPRGLGDVAAAAAVAAAVAAVGGGMESQVDRQRRRLYVGNLPPPVSEGMLMQVFSAALQHLDAGAGASLRGVSLHSSRKFAFLEFVGPADATRALSLDGLQVEGYSLKLRRPKDYVPLPGESADPLPPQPSQLLPGVVSTTVPDGPNKVYIGNLPLTLGEIEVKELLASFGALRAFHLVTDGGNGPSRGFGFCEYLDPSVTNAACEGLNDTLLQGRALVVQRAHVGASNNGGGPPGGGMPGPGGVGGIGQADPFVPSGALENPDTRTILNMGIPSGAIVHALFENASPESPSRVVQLLNLVWREDVQDDDDFEDVKADIIEQCSKFGTLLSWYIPRPPPEDFDRADEPAAVPCVGRVFVQFDSLEASKRALEELSGRKYNGRTVITAYFDEDKYESRSFP
jgi:splicing factor U2AF 65 kDa subunit